jgi:hypothetical protein
MRKMLSALVAGLAAAGGAAVLAGAAQAQPYGYYSGWNGNAYAYRYAPPRAYGYDGRYTRYGDGYYGGNGGYSRYYGLTGSAFAAAIAPEILGDAPNDQYGPDPNGMIAPDGHRIKCKLLNRYNRYAGHSMTRRECW